MTTPAWIGLGSNLGDRKAILDDAVASLSQVPGVVVKAVSTYHETRPIGGPPNQGPFLNAAAHLETSLDPHQLLATLQRIENEAGRVRVIRWGERTLDLDILIFGTKFLDTPELKLPHPRLAFRRFVLAPLAEIAPQIVDTMTKRTIADLLANLDRKPRLLALEGADGAWKKALVDRLTAELESPALRASEMIDDVDSSDDSTLIELEAFEAKAQAIDRELLMIRATPVHWVIADYCLPFEVNRAISSSLRRIRDDTDEAASRQRYSLIRRVQEISTRAYPPDLAILLPNTDVQRRPGTASFPLLKPDSNDPEAIVDEVVATCRGIEGV